MTILNHFSSYLEQFLWDEGKKKDETQNRILKDKKWWKLNFILLDTIPSSGKECEEIKKRKQNQDEDEGKRNKNKTKIRKKGEIVCN